MVNYITELNFKNKLNKYYIFSIIFFIALLALLLYALKQRNKHLKQREELYKLEIEQERQNSKISTLTALLDGQEQERARLARDLHDGLGGLLSGTKIQLTHLNDKIDNHSKKDMAKSIHQLDGAVDELRRVAHNLMPDLLLKYGLEEALKEYAIRMSNEQLDIDVQFLSYTNSLDKENQLLVYRIIQELVNNAIKHANAAQIIIQFVEDETNYSVTVEDDGKGFDMNNTKLTKSAGLHNIQSRIQFLKGQLNIHSEIDLGTSIEFQFPKI
ncbi:sensor histidine kinase [Empedobacter falsenii]|uniref:sensor histidine kinase n=1 Tax=Empedobacter falsenii TaxID=343874 RepID=UPI0021ADA3B6|nr:sensor histidine kinase [Empedobacter falsenii]